MQNINFNEPDINIVKALKNIKWPLINYEGHKIFLHERYNGINYTINHISEKRHFLKVRDIEIITHVLTNPINTVIVDRRKRKLYFGRRKGNKGNDKKPFLLIVVEVYGKLEYITTLYPVNKITKCPHK